MLNVRVIELFQNLIENKSCYPVLEDIPVDFPFLAEKVSFFQNFSAVLFISLCAEGEELVPFDLEYALHQRKPNTSQ